MSESPLDHSEAHKRISAALETKDYQAVAGELKQLLSLLECTAATEYINYVEYKFLLHQVYSELDDWPSCIQTLKELNSHFLQKTNPRTLTPRGLELYLQTWSYLGYIESEHGDKQAAVNTFEKCLPILIALKGIESPEVETLKWYIFSLQKYGRIISDEPEAFSSDDPDEEGLRCSFCLTGQVDIVSGPSVYICRKCINRFNSFRPDADYIKHLRLACANSKCAFLCENPDGSSGLFPGPGVHICAACLDLCEKLGDERTLPLNA